MRTDSEIIIEIDARACVENGYELLESANGVILCGSSIPPEYFLRVLDRSSGVDLLQPDSPADQSVRCPQDIIASLQEKLRLQQDQYEIMNAEFAEFKRNHAEKMLQGQREVQALKLTHATESNRQATDIQNLQRKVKEQADLIKRNSEKQSPVRSRSEADDIRKKKSTPKKA